MMKWFGNKAWFPPPVVFDNERFTANVEGYEYSLPSRTGSESADLLMVRVLREQETQVVADLIEIGLDLKLPWEFYNKVVGNHGWGIPGNGNVRVMKRWTCHECQGRGKSLYEDDHGTFVGTCHQCTGEGFEEKEMEL